MVRTRRPQLDQLTPKQNRFVDEYLVDLNMTQAAIRAGYSAKTAGQIGFELLNKPEIQCAVQCAFNARVKRTQVSQDRVVLELAKLAFSNMRSFAEWSGDHVALKDSRELDEADMACVVEVSRTDNRQSTNVKIKLHDKIKALELLGRHLGMFSEKLELTGQGGGPITHDLSSESIKAAFRALYQGSRGSVPQSGTEQ